ncbi:MAG: cation transporter [Calditrichaeota bacterium]|nr:MAG: cation transporter [Calditrichota bacterium]
MTEDLVPPDHVGAFSNREAIRQSRFAMGLSLFTGFFMLLLKIVAYGITGSAAILSDAAESVVHVLAVGFAAFSLWYGQRPADTTHPYGHDRISFFSAGFEGAMIIIAAVYIIYEAIHKWLAGLQLQHITEGTALVGLAVIINGALGWYLIHMGRKHHSLVLEANGKHVLTDSWTSLGVIVALMLTRLTGWLPFDPLLAILVALNILWSGSKLVRRSIAGLMDEADPQMQAQLTGILTAASREEGIQFHHLRHRNAGNRLIVDVHLLFPQETSISRAHELATRIERLIMNELPMQVEVITHLEPIEGHDEIHRDLLHQERHDKEDENERKKTGYNPPTAR